MFGIGLPEMLLIMALALIVIGPDKLPDLARSLAKGLMELKKTAESLKDSFAEEGNPLKEIRPELEEAAKSLKSQLLDVPLNPSTQTGLLGAGTSEQKAAEAYQELLKQTGNTVLPHDDSPAGPALLDSAAPEILSEDPSATTKAPPAVT